MIQNGPPIPVPMMEFGRDSAGIALVTGHFFCLPGVRRKAGDIFQAARPHGEVDAIEGGICSVSGLFFPAHRLVETSRGVVGDMFATPWPEDFEEDNFG